MFMKPFRGGSLFLHFARRFCGKGNKRFLEIFKGTFAFYFNEYNCNGLLKFKLFWLVKHILVSFTGDLQSFNDILDRSTFDSI